MLPQVLPALATRWFIVLTVLLLPVAAAGPAGAGGPTSVLLSAPGLGKTASLYTGEASYQALADYVGAFTTPGAGAEDDGGPGKHAVGDSVSLTWLIHDVTVWRVDRIYVDAPGGPWIATQQAMTEDLWEAAVTWHRPTQAKALTRLLDSLGLLDGTPSAAADVSTSPGSTQPQVAAGSSAEDRPERGAATSSESSPTEGHDTNSVMAAGLVGLTAGVMLTSLVLVVARRRSGSRSWAGDDSLDLDADVLTSKAPEVVR